MGRRIRKPDLNDNIVDSDIIIDGSIEAVDLKTLDVGDGSGINAETLPYDHTAASPTIWDKIQSIISSVGGFGFEIFATNPSITDYQLSSSLQIDTTKFLLVFYNGQFLNIGATKDFEVITTTLADDTIQLKWAPELNKDLYVVFEALP